VAPIGADETVSTSEEANGTHTSSPNRQPSQVAITGSTVANARFWISTPAA
jgi:hypothetical protein